MKIPRYMYMPQISVGHPSVTLRATARALEIEAGIHRHHKNAEAAWALKEAAYQLIKVADGESFAEAFDWPKSATEGAK